MRNQLEHLRHIFTEALDIASAQERNAYIDKGCSDAPELLV
jgi:hypothetical protein